MGWIAMRLGYLQALRAVMETGSVTEAARRLSRTQPQVSRLIAMLSNELGFPLFQKHGRQLLPTQEGVLFYERTKHILSGFDEITRISADIRGHKDSWLRVVAQPHLAHVVVPRAIAGFLGVHPEIRVSLATRSRAEMTQWLSGRQVDLGLAALPMEVAGIATEPFAKARIVAAIPQRHPLARRRVIGPKDLKGQPFVALMPYTLIRHKVDDQLASLGVSIMIRAEASSGVTACQLVAEGVGVSLTDPIVARTIEGIVVRPWEPALYLDYGFLSSSAFAPAQPTLAFRRIVAETARKLAPLEVQLVSQ